MSRVLICAVVAIAVLGLEPAAAFNCNTARTPTERTICAHNHLQVLDAQMEGCYFATYNSLRGKLRREFRNAQRGWLNYRNSCGRNVGCLTGVYEERVEELCYGD
jgi:uncharacterized protein